MTDQEALGRLRAQIDGIDEEVLRLLTERARCAQEVGRIKNGQHIYRPEREAQVLRRIQDLNQGPLTAESVAFLFREIMSACLSLEEPLDIAVLGPLGSFSEAAAVKHFGHAARLAPMESIDEVFREAESGHADYAVVPVENSTGGAVGRSMDLLLTTSLKACGEVVLRVHQHLLTNCGGFFEVKKVYSHPQSLSQCHEWLNRMLPGAERVPVASNSLAAQMASEEPNAAAIAGEAAGERYGLQALARNIEDEPNNTTRFLVLGKHDAGPSGKDKTSLVMSAPNRTGALHYLLTPFAEAGVSLTRLESRPERNALWEYVFYADVVGHRSEEPVKSALQALEDRAAFLKVLGSYPQAVF